jgi:hypothetical protein
LDALQAQLHGCALIRLDLKPAELVEKSVISNIFYWRAFLLLSYTHTGTGVCVEGPFFFLPLYKSSF